MTDPISFWLQVLGVLLTLAGMSLVSIIEAALVSVNPVRLRQLHEQGESRAALVARLAARPEELLGALIIMINLFVLLAANLTTAFASQWGSGAIVWMNLVVLFALLIFGEIIPKTFSVHYAEAVALRTAHIAYFLNVLLSPLVFILNGISTGILRALIAIHVLPGRIHPVPTAFSGEDIKQLVTAGEQSGEVEATEREMIHGVIEFSETTAHEVMVPRTDLVALSDDVGIDEVIETFMASGHSRIPVYAENADNILGIVYVKDVLIRLHAAEQAGEPVPMLNQLLRPATFVPESKKTDDLLREMQRTQVHLAVVVDEYGGTAGIITIEDLLEEIVGDIIDEYDKERLEIVQLADGTTLVDGRAGLDTIEETFDIPLPDTEAETVSGLITEILGRIPEAGDRVIVSGVEFEVLEVVHNRVEHLHAVVLPSDSIPTDDEL